MKRCPTCGVQWGGNHLCTTTGVPADPALVETDCPSGKVRYPDQYSANGALLHAWRARHRGDTRRRERSAYRCDECDGFHLTSWTIDEQEARHG